MFIFSSLVNRFGVPLPICVFMDSHLSNLFTLLIWQFCEKNAIIVQCIPPKIDVMHKWMNVGFFEWFTSELNKLLMKRYHFNVAVLQLIFASWFIDLCTYIVNIMLQVSDWKQTLHLPKLLKCTSRDSEQELGAKYAKHLRCHEIEITSSTTKTATRGKIFMGLNFTYYCKLIINKLWVITKHFFSICDIYKISDSRGTSYRLNWPKNATTHFHCT